MGNYMEEQKVEPKIKRINGYLHRITPVFDKAGKLLSFAVSPIMVEFKPRDLMQVVVGASILAVPVAFTEETWKLGEGLPMLNVLLLSAISILFIGMFVYFNFYRYMLKNHVIEYIKRIFSIYFVSLLIVGILMTIIQKCPWQTDFAVAIKRVLIVTFPSSMSAAVSDTIK